MPKACKVCNPLKAHLAYHKTASKLSNKKGKESHFIQKASKLEKVVDSLLKIYFEKVQNPDFYVGGRGGIGGV